jgi:hypothetical protein
MHSVIPQGTGLRADDCTRIPEEIIACLAANIFQISSNFLTVQKAVLSVYYRRASMPEAAVSDADNRAPAAA